MSDKKRQQLRTLAALKDTPNEQAAYAATLLKTKFGLEVVRAALDVLARTPRSETHDELRALYAYYADHDGTRDSGTYTRTAILRALRPILSAHDADLIVSAVCTYEFLPPAFSEEAALLRATALIMLNDLDEQLASYFATRLLADGHTERMSGEPALTAVQVLASQENLLPLYFYAVQQVESRHTEVTAECLRQLSGAPSAVIDQLVAQYAASGDRPDLVGLFDMLLLGGGATQHREYLSEFLATTHDLDLYRYLVTVMVTSPNSNVRGILFDSVRFERDPEKIDAALDALDLVPEDPDMESLRAQLSQQTGRHLRRMNRRK